LACFLGIEPLQHRLCSVDGPALLHADVDQPPHPRLCGDPCSAPMHSRLQLPWLQGVTATPTGVREEREDRTKARETIAEPPLNILHGLLLTLSCVRQQSGRNSEWLRMPELAALGPKCYVVSGDGRPAMSPLGLMRALEICLPSGMRMAFTTPPELMATENTLHRIASMVIAIDSHSSPTSRDGHVSMGLRDWELQIWPDVSPRLTAEM